MTQVRKTNSADRFPQQPIDENTVTKILEAGEELGVTKVVKLHVDNSLLRDTYATVKLKSGEEAVIRVFGNKADGREGLTKQYETANIAATSPFPFVLGANSQAMLYSTELLNENGDLYQSAYERFYDEQSNEQLQNKWHAVVKSHSQLIIQAHSLSKVTKAQLSEEQVNSLFDSNGWYKQLNNAEKIESEDVKNKFSHIFEQAQKYLPAFQDEIQGHEDLLVGNTHAGMVIERSKEEGGDVLLASEGLKGHRINDFRHIITGFNGMRLETPEETQNFHNRIMNFDLNPVLDIISAKSGQDKQFVAECAALHTATMIVRQCLTDQAVKAKGNMTSDMQKKSDSIKELWAHRYEQLAEVAWPSDQPKKTTVPSAGLH